MTDLIQGNRLFLDALRAEGVTRMFGNPGTSEGPMIGILHEYPEIEYYMALQEGVAVGMGDAYARATGTVACISLHIDNGLANGFGLMVDMLRAGTPAVVTAGNRDVRQQAAGRSDLARMAEPFSKWSVEITDADQISTTMRRAFQEARTPPTGPVFVGAAINVMEEVSERLPVPSVDVYGDPEPDSAAIDAAAELLAGATAPMIVVGDRVRQYRGVDAVVRLAEAVGAPVYGHVGGNRNFPSEHALWSHQLALRSAEGLAALRSADVVVAIGCPAFEDFFYRPEPFLHPETRLVQIDTNGAEIGRSEAVEVGIVAGVNAAASQLAEAVESRLTQTQRDAATERVRSIGQATAEVRASWLDSATADRERVPISPASFGMELGRLLPEGANFFHDSVSSAAEVHMGIAHRSDLNYWGARGGAIGWGMGSTLGLHLAAPGVPTFGVIGDGSAMMTVQALWTAVNYGIPVTYLVCNNGAYRILKVNQQYYHRIKDLPPPEIYNAADFDTPLDFRAQAEAYGAVGTRVEHLDELGPAMVEAAESGEVNVIDVVLDGSV